MGREAVNGGERQQYIDEVTGLDIRRSGPRLERNQVLGVDGRGPLAGHGQLDRAFVIPWVHEWLRLDHPAIEFFEWTSRWTSRAIAFILLFAFLINDLAMAARTVWLLLCLTLTFLVARIQFRHAVSTSARPRGIYLYRRPTRILVRIYNIWAVAAGIGLELQIKLFVDGRPLDAGLTYLLAFGAPAFLACYFSWQLRKFGASDLNYVKGTSTCREVLIYWTALLILLYAPLPGVGELRGMFAGGLIPAAGIIGIGRLAGSGYKEFREAVAVHDLTEQRGHGA